MVTFSYPNAGPLTCNRIGAFNRCPDAQAGEAPYTLDSSGLTCSRPDPETYTLTLTPTSTTIEPDQSTRFTVTVENQLDYQPPKNPVFARSFAVYMLMLPFSIAFALELGESIVLDPITGNYKLTYVEKLKGGVKVLKHATFFPATKIVPLIDSRFNQDSVDTVAYRYSVNSTAQSRQILNTLSFDLLGQVVGSQNFPTDMQISTPEQAIVVLEANKRALITPTGWQSAISTYENGMSVSWHPVNSAAGIQPKGHLKGFGFSSQSLPGLGVAQLGGQSDAINGYAGEGPDSDSDIGKQIEALEDNDFVSRNAAVPIIAVPVPFDAAVLLDRIRTHVATWPNKQLLDPVLATQLDRYLVSAAEAYRRNQLKAGKEHIETLREMLKREHKDLDRDDDVNENGKRAEKNDDHRTVNQHPLIDRLAARVLDFDVKYVLKRMEGEKTEKKMK